MFALVSGLAKLEREAIRERVKAGLRAARARGVKLGRRAAAIDVKEARRRRAEGMTMREIAEHFGISVRTLQCRLRGATKPPSKSEP